MFHRCESTSDVIILEDGLLKIVWQFDTQDRTAAFIGYPGYVLTRSHPVRDFPYPVSVFTVTDCNLYRIPIRVFNELLGANQEATRILIAQQQAALGNLMSALLDHRSLTADQKFQKLIVQLLRAVAPMHSTFDSIRLPATLSEGDIAHLIGVSVTEVSRIKNRLIAAGKLDRSGRHIIVLRPELWLGAEAPNADAVVAQ